MSEIISNSLPEIRKGLNAYTEEDRKATALGSIGYRKDITPKYLVISRSLEPIQHKYEKTGLAWINYSDDSMDLYFQNKPRMPSEDQLLELKNTVEPMGSIKFEGNSAGWLIKRMNWALNVETQRLSLYMNSKKHFLSIGNSECGNECDSIKLLDSWEAAMKDDTNKKIIDLLASLYTKA
jgi:hypothetical protein